MIAGMLTGKQTSIFDQPVIAGQEIVAHQNLRSAIFPQGPARARRGAVPPARRRGAAEHRHQPQDRPRTSRRTGPAPEGGRHAEHQRQAVPHRRHLRDRLDAAGRRHHHGYRHGRARSSTDPAGSLSCIYVEGDDPAQNDALIAAIEKAHPGFDARSMGEAQANFSSLMGQIDTFLLMTVSLALLVGVVGIVNTMLMSTTERFAEFGVLRTNGWSQGEHPGPGDARECLPGPARRRGGCLLAWSGAFVANQFISGGIHLGMPPSLWAIGHRPLGRDRDPGRALPRMAGRPAGPDGGDPPRLPLMTVNELMAVSPMRRNERVEPASGVGET